MDKYFFVGALLLSTVVHFTSATTSPTQSVQIVQVQRYCYSCPPPGQTSTADCIDPYDVAGRNSTDYTVCPLGYPFCKKTVESNIGKKASVTRECASTCTEKEVSFGAGTTVKCCQDNLCNPGNAVRGFIAVIVSSVLATKLLVG